MNAGVPTSEPRPSGSGLSEPRAPSTGLTSVRAERPLSASVTPPLGAAGSEKADTEPLPHGRGSDKPLPHGRGSDKPLPHGRGSDGAAGSDKPAVDELGLLQPEEEVLSTLNRDGSRRWLRPRLSQGRFLVGRQLTAYLLIAVFTLIPHVRINGEPAMLLDVVHRKFALFGIVFRSTDTVVLAFFLLACAIAVFLFTALLGRVWCGWACPQTVYLEFLYRPIERLFDHTRGRGGQPRRPRSPAGWAAMYGLYLLASMFLAHTFLAYFVGVDELLHWMRRSPLEHPASFAVMAVTTALMMFNFSYFREQTCLVACPYGRFQAALLDRDSLIISYDAERGEPRSKVRSQQLETGNKKLETRNRKSEIGDGGIRPVTASREAVQLPVAGGPAAFTSDFLLQTSDFAPGDCVDCGLCVVTCPTGIDIRKGLQMECVGCAQCIDACDLVMDKVKRPRGLIRYTSEARLAGQRGRILRTRVVLYSMGLLALLGALTAVVATRGPAEVMILQGLGLPFNELPDGRIGNPIRIKITNRTQAAATYRVEIVGAASATLITDAPAFSLEPGQTRTEGAIITLPRSDFAGGQASVVIRVSDGAGFTREFKRLLHGPAAR